MNIAPTAWLRSQGDEALSSGTPKRRLHRTAAGLSARKPGQFVGTHGDRTTGFPVRAFRILTICMQQLPNRPVARSNARMQSQSSLRQGAHNLKYVMANGAAPAISSTARCERQLTCRGSSGRDNAKSTKNKPTRPRLPSNSLRGLLHPAEHPGPKLIGHCVQHFPE